MKERPIIFTADEVRAVIAGTKTQFRRIVKPQPVNGKLFWEPQWHTGPAFVGSPLDSVREAIRCPFGSPGDQLWVREAFAETEDEHGIPIIVYRADDRHRIIGLNDGVYESFDGRIGGYEMPTKWKPSIHMPRWASRLTLAVASVRVPRVQDISEEDAIAVNARRNAHLVGFPVQEVEYTQAPRDAFAQEWDYVHGPGAWDRNDWVWAVEFEVKK